MDIKAAAGRCFAPGSTMGVEASEDDGGATVLLAGSLDMQNSASLQALLSWIVERLPARARLLVDLKRVDYISSTGVGAMTVALASARKREIRLLVRNIQPKVRSIFEVLGFMGFFEEAPEDDSNAT